MKVYLGLILLFSNMAIAKKSPIIKVRIATAQKQVKISGLDVTRHIWPKKSYKEYSGFKQVVFNCESKNLKRKYKKPIRLASLKSKTGMVTWDKERFRGKMHIQTSENFQGCDLINELSLEEYIATLLPKEMNAKWPIEALKAQAVAARTYAHYKIKTKQVSRIKGFKTNYDIENSEYHQVNGSFFDMTKKTIRAAKQTRGQMLVQKSGAIVPIFFHSKCGGKTLLPNQVWENEVEGYTSVSCPFCHNHGMKNWSRLITDKELKTSLRRGIIKYNKVKASHQAKTLLSDHYGSSVLKLYLGEDFHVLKKSRLRTTMGRKTLPSNYFVINKQKNGYRVKGSGYGHGVGLCQFGAKQLALQGYNYKQILKHYFPNMKLREVY